MALIDKQMFLDEAALRIVHAYVQRGFDAIVSAQLAYEAAEALWKEREHRKVIVSDSPPPITPSTVGPQL
jgi:hypothetical protein